MRVAEYGKTLAVTYRKIIFVALLKAPYECEVSRTISLISQISKPYSLNSLPIRSRSERGQEYCGFF